MFDPNPKLVLTNQFGEVSINEVDASSTFGATNKSTPVVLTAAQVIALNATPIDIIPAIAGKIIEVVAVIYAYTKSTAFTVGSSKVIKTQYKTSGQLINSVPDTGLLDQAASTEAVGLGAGAGGIAIRGKAVQVTSDDTTIAVGTGSTLTVTAYYNILE